ncbi:MAG: DUF547 domain-containing protein [Planctomycetes bacterium]|nr:DUF547 domain-containing protein [Planctomycetota bacterium]
MAKHLIILITLLTMLISIAGCSPAEPEPVELEKSPKVELPTPEPNDLEPTKVEPVQVQLPAVPEPNEFELAKPEPTEPPIPEPNELESAKIPIPEPNEPESAETEPIEPSIPEPNELELIDTEPPEDKVPVAEPNDLESAQVESEMAEPNGLETVPVERNEAEPNQPEILSRVSFHDKCADIFKNFVDKDGMVDYRRLKLKRSQLRRLLSEFDRLDHNEYKSWSKDDKIAFWINAYNIKLLHIIVRNYPIESKPWFRIMWDPTDIRHIAPVGKIGTRKWDTYKFMVMDEQFTLAAVEERFFRKAFADPRIFFAISYASLSGPPLHNEPYYGHKLDEQLEDQTKRFLSSPRAFKIDRDRQRVYLSALLAPTWHGKELVSKFATNKKFKDKPPAIRAILNFIANYVSERDASFLEVGNYSVKDLKYDWRLNDSRSR